MLQEKQKASKQTNKQKAKPKTKENKTKIEGVMHITKRFE